MSAQIDLEGVGRVFPVRDDADKQVHDFVAQRDGRENS